MRNFRKSAPCYEQGMFDIKLYARYLENINFQSINSTDAFVEVRFLETIDKTDVVTSLNPVWNSEQFVFDTDERELTEEWLQLR